MVHLAESYKVKPRTFILDVGNIRLNAELIGRVFGNPSRGNQFPTLDDKNPAHMAIKKRFHRRTTIELQDSVYSCPMATKSDRMEFRRYFLLVIMKIFLCPTTQQVISPWHIYPVLDVSDPRRFNWPLETLKWFDMAVEKYKLKVNKTCEGCMFVMLSITCPLLLSKYSIFSGCNTVSLTTVMSMSHDSLREPRNGRLLTRKGKSEEVEGRSPQAERRKAAKKNTTKVWTKSFGCTKGNNIFTT
ncbi:hypothetical protein AHAS_Ahas17G0294800 [Arachis hypogaea]